MTSEPDGGIEGGRVGFKGMVVVRICDHNFCKMEKEKKEQS